MFSIPPAVSLSPYLLSYPPLSDPVHILTPQRISAVLGPPPLSLPLPPFSSAAETGNEAISETENSDDSDYIPEEPSLLHECFPELFSFKKFRRVGRKDSSAPPDRHLPASCLSTVGKEHVLRGVGVKNKPAVSKYSSPLELMSSPPRPAAELSEMLHSLPEWLRESECLFFPNNGKKEDERALILVDGHSSRFQPDLWEICGGLNIDLLLFLSHSSHEMQPLDKHVNAQFKKEVQKDKDEFFLKPDSSNIREFLQAIRDGAYLAQYPRSVRASFRECGIVPFNPSLVLSKLPADCPEIFRAPPQHRPRWGLSGLVVTDPQVIETMRERGRKSCVTEEDELQAIEEELISTEAKETRIISILPKMFFPGFPK
jgi:hypothetical protein